MTVLKPTEGLLTFESEGHEGGPYHSRTLHVPSHTSGLTIGRGYDCRTKTEARIKVDLISVGIPPEKAKIIAKSSGLYGDKAKAHIKNNNLTSFEITQQQQVKLFHITFQEERSEARRLCSKPDVEEEYGKCNWDQLDKTIVDILVDLKFRGDYTPNARRKIQEYVAENDVEGLYGVIADRRHWLTVPADRFRRRVEFMKKRLRSMARE